MIIANAFNVDLAMKKDSFLAQVVGKVVIDQMLNVEDGSLIHYC
jgi:hypothetical protein